MKRSLSTTLETFARQKFVLLSGPRQVGKTTLALEWASRHPPGRSLYLNWDVPEDREAILKQTFLHNEALEALVLDEIHKYARWKSWLKGLFDRQGRRLEVVVTGSARLELFQKSGDSLLGRYESLRLYPLTLGELIHGQVPPPPKDWLHPQSHEIPGGLWERLNRCSGFPEPFAMNDPLQRQRWATRRRTLLVHEDLRDLSRLRDLSLVEHLALLLPERVGSPLSLNALREDLQVAHGTISSWVDALDRLYYCFRISPWHKRITRSLKSERKLYLWDWSLVDSPGARFENMVAVHLSKAVAVWNDLGYGEFALHYLRDKEKNEVDFMISQKNRPLVLVECKTGDTKPSSALLKLGSQLGDVPLVQLLESEGVDRRRGHTRVVSAGPFLAALA